MPGKVLHLSPETDYCFHGYLGDLTANVISQWLLPLPDSCPRILEMFRERDFGEQPQQPWAGEFVGKYLTTAVQIYRITRNEALGKLITQLMDEMISMQDSDGYLGAWAREHRFSSGFDNAIGQFVGPWDAWGHYHTMLAFILWHLQTGDGGVLNAACRMADHLVQEFMLKNKDFADTCNPEMNLSPIHSLTLLYQITGKEEYLLQARKIVDEFAREDCGNYFQMGLNNIPYWQSPKPRWEALHEVIGMAALYEATGEKDFLTAFASLYASMRDGDRHNNGGFSSGEKAQGNPYHTGAIETCCTVAWSALCVEMLQLTGDMAIADELELSLFNSGFGFHSPTGRWVTYNTPMDGVRKSYTQDLAFQMAPGTSELGCCSVNGGRILGLVGEWALLTGQDGALYVNYYGEGEFETALPSGKRVKISQQTSYPLDRKIVLTLDLEEEETFDLALRIPAWSAATVLTCNQEGISTEPGQYCHLVRKWQKGDTLELQLDFSFRYWFLPEEHYTEEQDKSKTFASIYRGPLLLAWDRGLNASASEMPGAVIPETLVLAEPPHRWRKPYLTLKGKTEDGQEIYLCDFASAGMISGAFYRSWLPVIKGC